MQLTVVRFPQRIVGCTKTADTFRLSRARGRAVLHADAAGESVTVRHVLPPGAVAMRSTRSSRASQWMHRSNPMARRRRTELKIELAGFLKMKLGSFSGNEGG